jgi:hypothetical protein
MNGMARSNLMHSSKMPGTIWRGNGLMDRDVVRNRAPCFIRYRSGRTARAVSGVNPRQIAEDATSPGTIPFSATILRGGVCAEGVIVDKRLHARSTMRTNIILALTAMGITVLSFPVMAQTWRYANIPLSMDNVFWHLAVPPPYGPAYGSIARAPMGRFARGPFAAPLPRILDCVHVPFPQCSGAGQ